METETQNLDVKDASGGQPDAMDDSSTPTEVFARDANAGKTMQDFIGSKMAKKGPPADETAPEAEPEAVTSGEEEGIVQRKNDTPQLEDETTAEKSGEKAETEEEARPPKEATE